MRNGEASKTALRVAVQRAAHQLFDVPLVFTDPLALRILGAGEEVALRSAEAENRTPFARAFRAAVVARSRFCEDLANAALAGGIRQIVLLGAGLDTFGCRASLPQGARVVEVDHPATQSWKMATLAAAGIAMPPALGFVPIDFATTGLADGLVGGRVDLGQPAFFSWLGVTYYLSPDTVRTALRFIGTMPAGSEVVFDYFEPARHYEQSDRPGFMALGKQVAAGGEPWQSYFEPADMAKTLRGAGFDKCEDLDSATMATRYFAGRDDGLEPTGPIHFVRARVGA